MTADWTRLPARSAGARRQPHRQRGARRQPRGRTTSRASRRRRSSGSDHGRADEPRLSEIRAQGHPPLVHGPAAGVSVRRLAEALLRATGCWRWSWPPRHRAGCASTSRACGSSVRQFFGDLMRRHEEAALLGSTYMLIAALHLGRAVQQVGLRRRARRPHPRGRRRLPGGQDLGPRASLRLPQVARGLAGLLRVSFAFVFGVVRLPWPSRCGGGRGTLFELLPLPLDDNFRIPLSAGFVMKLLGG